MLNILLSKLQELVLLRNELQLQTIQRIQQAEKIQNFCSSLSNYKEYFWLLCRLINKYTKEEEEGEEEETINIRTAILQVASFIQDNGELTTFTTGHNFIDHCLVGLLQTCTVLLQHDSDFKKSVQGSELLRNIFQNCLFNLPQSFSDDTTRPLCDTKSARQAAFDLLLQLVTRCKETYLELQSLLLRHHSVNPKTKCHGMYGWNYWPLEQERSPVGYVGLINLGATCYMASCVQQLFMIPEARTAILEAPVQASAKHSGILREVQKMFAYLQLSNRKAYNPKSFCKTYTMDKQPLNTGEQKDMTEFFTDFVSKIEEMSPNLVSFNFYQTCSSIFFITITNSRIENEFSYFESNFYFVF